MSLRDYFAIHAPPMPDRTHELRRKIEANRRINDKSCVYRERSDEQLETEWRYEFADEMLEARKAK